MSFGYVVCGFGANPTRGAPLSISLSAQTDVANVLGVGSGASGTTPVDIIDNTAAAAGGDGSYSYAWVLTQGPANVISGSFGTITQGINNAAQYLKGQIDYVQNNINGHEPPADVVMISTCTVTDGTGAFAVIAHPTNIVLLP
tara:strand:+ start:170 stop:598 length:429 start_codon:yes stop_codon:yes gene_type:complete